MEFEETIRWSVINIFGENLNYYLINLFNEINLGSPELIKALEKAGKKRKPVQKSYGLSALQELGRNSGKKTPTMRDSSPNTSAKKKKPQKVDVPDF